MPEVRALEMDRAMPIGSLVKPKSVVDLEYEALPEAVKMAVTQQEFRWMGQANRDRLMQDLCEPDPEPDY